MQFKQCPKCGNSDTRYEIVKCTQCKQIIGCYEQRSFAGKMFNSEVQGCCGITDELSHSKCPRCNKSAGFFGTTFQTYPITL